MCGPRETSLVYVYSVQCSTVQYSTVQYSTVQPAPPAWAGALFRTRSDPFPCSVLCGRYVEYSLVPSPSLKLSIMGAGKSRRIATPTLATPVHDGARVSRGERRHINRENLKARKNGKQ